MSLSRRLTGLLVAVALLATACTQAVSGQGSHLGAAVPGTPHPDPIVFRDCTRQLAQTGLPVQQPALEGKLRVGCGQVTVPVDYAHPNGAKISLTVVRIHDIDNTARPTQPLFVNPGGPGGSAVQFGLQFVGEIPPAVMANYDVIASDPRGVTLSSPIHCISDKQKAQLLARAWDVRTPSGFAGAKQQAKQFARACERAVGGALRFYNTVNSARDMDQIRQAIGSDRMNYLGFSYGTELGWTYAHLFPGRVRAMVLDGAVDPDTDATQQLGEQLKGFEDAFGQFAANCKTVSPCNRLTDPLASALAITAAARRSPLSTSSGRRLTAGLAYTGILEALYEKQLWPQLAAGLISGVNGDGSGLLALADRYNQRASDGSYTNIFDAYTTISCNDAKPGPSDDEIRRLGTEWSRQYPLFGNWFAFGLFNCQQWQPDRTAVPKPAAATPRTVLVLGNLHDPATPYRGAQDLAKDLGNADLLTWDGEGHTSYKQGSSCVDGYVNRYLLSLAVPRAGSTCPAQ